MSGPLFDPGLQPERTRLAWRRTLLSMVVACLAALRVLPPVVGTWSIAVCIGGLLTIAMLVIAVQRRARRIDLALEHGTPLPGAGVLAACAVTLLGGALLGVVTIAWR